MDKLKLNSNVQLLDSGLGVAIHSQTKPLAVISDDLLEFGKCVDQLVSELLFFVIHSDKYGLKTEG